MPSKSPKNLSLRLLLTITFTLFSAISGKWMSLITVDTVVLAVRDVASVLSGT
jgi:hypothetical protein